MVKSKIATKSNDYPKIMKHKKSNKFVLFFNDSEGVVIHTEINNDFVGLYSHDWFSDQFEDFDGEITLSNN